jgi:ATP-dependent DNA ligase
VWDDPHTIVERKLDGHRFKLHICHGINRLDSRRPSVNGGLYVEKTDNAPAIRDFPLPDLDGTVLDGELVAGEDSNSVAHALGSHASDAERSALHYVVFDILFFRGRDVRDRSDAVRRALLEKCFSSTSLAHAPMIRLMPRPASMTPDEKKRVLIEALAAGEEGVMIKDTTRPYGKGWTKVKREARYDVVVMGYAPPKEKSIKKGQAEATITKRAANGWVGAIIFGQYVDGRLVEFGQTSGMDDATLEDVSRNRDAYIGRVFEISAQERFPSGKFRHPRFERFRDGEKLAHDCIYRPDEV